MSPSPASEALPPTDKPLPRLPPRADDAHKGTFGTALLVGGSRGMSGAVALAGMGALRGGAGLVRLAVPQGILATVAAIEPSYMTVALPADRAGRIASAARDAILAAAESATVVALGPGLGRSLGLSWLVAWLYEHLAQPMVVDADGLNALASRPDALLRPGGPRILTPHPGEFARLAGRPVAPEQRVALAVELAARWQAVVVLKGHRTCVTDGRERSVNSTGNPGLARGGSGDVLTGLITALACQGLGPFDAARLGVHVHGLAGDLAAAELGQVAMIASDLIRFLPPGLSGHGLIYHLQAFDDESLVSADYEEAARCHNACRKRGVAGSPIDFLICAVALRRQAEIFTADRDFSRYARHLPIRLHRPRAARS